ncbi:response regulator transcription factor [uncultured Microscilla sp.]|uniref:response regulator transcription factor n=1 Tax=uncultured Microscilla sp. TaxID=432653 RepID=UPI0026186553|nr:response regulator transcription factor [uncultured Microscilla sp.]
MKVSQKKITMKDEIKILLVEDDNNLGQLLQEYLQIKGFPTTLRRDGEAGLETFHSVGFDLCILDVMLPKMDGFTLAEKIREQNKKIPIIFLTAKSMKEDAIKGFKAGADDYIHKPFSMEELLLRIEAIMRRVGEQPVTPETQEYFEVGSFSFDYSTQKLQRNGESKKLTSKEAALLKMLCEHKNRTLERSKALKKIWLDDNYFNARSMDVYITKLRKYLKSDENIQIVNVHGQGFKLVELV